MIDKDKVIYDRILTDAEAMADMAKLWLEGSKKCLKLAQAIKKGTGEQPRQNGLAKSGWQTLQTVMLSIVIGIGGFIWTKVNSNNETLIDVKSKQSGVLDSLTEIKGNIKTITIDVQSLKMQEIRQDDRLDGLESKNHSKP